MVITLTADIEAALTASAKLLGATPEQLALATLRERFVVLALDEPRDEWERSLRSIATVGEVALSNEALRRENLYD